MNLTLTRFDASADGIFGKITGPDGKLICFTLEHAYKADDDLWVPKVATGTYDCIRHPPRRLLYETFQITEVPPFQDTPVTEILIHCGDFDADSEGCVLVGTTYDATRIYSSRIAFAKFMALQDGCDSFTLIVK